MIELDLNKAMQNFRSDSTLRNAFNVRSHLHPDIPGQENAKVYLEEVNAFIVAHLARQLVGLQG